MVLFVVFCCFSSLGFRGVGGGSDPLCFISKPSGRSCTVAGGWSLLIGNDRSRPRELPSEEGSGTYEMLIVLIRTCLCAYFALSIWLHDQLLFFASHMRLRTRMARYISGGLFKNTSRYDNGCDYSNYCYHSCSASCLHRPQQ